MTSCDADLRQIELPQHCGCDRQGCRGEAIVVDTRAARELYIRCDPASLFGNASSPAAQAEQFYLCLSWILEQACLTMSHVVHERVFFRDLSRDHQVFMNARSKTYRRLGVAVDHLPLASLVQQAPCQDGQAYEMQVYAVAPNLAAASRVVTLPAQGRCPAAKIINIGGLRHLYVAGITGAEPSGQRLDTLQQQSDTMLATAAELLSAQGATYANVQRTWYYLRDIDRDYATFNRTRNTFLQHRNLTRWPASTGVQAQLFPAAARCGMDLYALLDMEGVSVEEMRAPTSSEVPADGSACARGIKLTLPEKTVFLLSGTASVDEHGRTAHAGDVRQQIERMLLNIRELLAPHGATYADFVQAITYLKSAADLDVYRDISKQWGIAAAPNSIVQADVCRPDLLCEMEAIAIIPAHRHEGAAATRGCHFG